ncbi:MAG: NADH-quinone oxidoreductase subunit C [Desulfurococcus sp.]|nr:NADH-quinone oxidoreductase subunit C [Desulfurococcus sp.]
MIGDSILDRYTRLAGELGGSYTIKGDTIHILIPRESLVKAALKLFSEYGLTYRTCVGVDERPLNGFFSLTHIFTDDAHGYYILVKTFLEGRNPVAPSIASEIPAADWCEMEAADLLGFTFEGREKSRLVLPSNWPEGVYPLRKDYRYDQKPSIVITPGGIGEQSTIEGIPVPIGPYHPALHEPEYFEVYVDEERVVDVKYRGFHVHRGIEKLGESRMTYQQVNFLAERICGICGFEHSTCYALAVEKAAGLEVPERAQFIRSIILEIERLHSHLLWLGVLFHTLGYDAGFMHMWRIREKIMVLAEMLTGSRKTYGVNMIGGVRKDISEEKKRKVTETLRELSGEFQRTVEAALSMPQIKRRLTGTGVLPREWAVKLGVEGPVARASGVNRDARRDLPYAAYKHTSFKVPVYTEGDNMARVLVRVDEVLESISIVDQLLDMLPGGPVILEKYEIPEGRVGVQVVEAPRGGDVHYVVTGRGRPYRWRVRAPTYSNIPALKIMLAGELLADVPLTIASIDPCFSCTDRVIVVRRSGGVEKLSFKVTQS